MFTHRNHLHVALTISALATAWASTLLAQGGPQARRPAPAPAPAPAAPAPGVAQLSLEPARSMLRHLVGRWRVEIRFAGNFDGAPDASGTRVVDSLFDDLRLQWTEALDSSRVRGQGFIGFDSHDGRLYSTAVYSAGSGAELLTGTLDLAEPVIAFSPVAPVAPAPPAGATFVLRMVDPDHFTWSPLDRGWRAVWTREP
jgi:hypothetical protein